MVWDALADTMHWSLSRPPAAVVARLTGVRGRRFGGPEFPATGAQVPGFRVVESVPGSRLRLEGRHRFSHYALDFELIAVTRRTRLSATTLAAFPGVPGTLYRTLVIGTRGHVLVVRRLLHSVRRRAECRAAPS